MSQHIAGAARGEPANRHLEQGTPVAALEAWRDVVMIRALWIFWLMVTALVAVITVNHGLKRWYTLVPLAVAWLVMLYGIAQKTAGRRTRAVCFIVGVAIGSVGSTLSTGFHLPNPFVALTAAVVIAALFADRRTAWWLLGVVAVLMGGVGCLFVMGPPFERLWHLEDTGNPLNWFRILCAFLAMTAGILSLVSLFRARLEKALVDAQSLMDVLAAENRQHRELLHDQQALQEQLRQAKNLEALGILSDGVAHDFNNLLLVIGSHTEMLQRRANPDARTDRSLSAIRDATDRAARLTQQLRTSKRQQVSERTQVQLALAIDESLSMIEPLMPDNLTMRVGALDADLWVYCVPGDLDQVLMNLCVNARDAIPHGGVVTVSLRREVRAPPEGGAPRDFACLAVSDTGEGMSDQTRSRIFDPFFTTKPADQSTGLGLSVVHGLVARAEGFVDVDTGEGRGATFRAYWPLCAAPELPVSKSGRAPRGRKGGESILLVDDDPSVRNVVAEMLKQRGYEVLTCVDGVEALDVYRRSESDIAMVIADVIMPRMGGQALWQELVELSPELPFLFCSGYTGVSLAVETLDRPTCDFLAKPFSSDLLFRKVDGLLAGRRAQGESTPEVVLGGDWPRKLRLPSQG